MDKAQTQNDPESMCQKRPAVRDVKLRGIQEIARVGTPSTPGGSRCETETVEGEKRA